MNNNCPWHKFHDSTRYWVNMSIVSGHIHTSSWTRYWDCKWYEVTILDVRCATASSQSPDLSSWLGSSRTQRCARTQRWRRKSWTQGKGAYEILFGVKKSIVDFYWCIQKVSPKHTHTHFEVMCVDFGEEKKNLSYFAQRPSYKKMWKMSIFCCAVYLKAEQRVRSFVSFVGVFFPFVGSWGKPGHCGRKGKKGSRRSQGTHWNPVLAWPLCFFSATALFHF